jgi:hypothetical protein
MKRFFAALLVVLLLFFNGAPAAHAYPGQNYINKRFGGTIKYEAIPGYRVDGISFDEDHHLYVLERPMKAGDVPGTVIVRQYSGVAIGPFKNGVIEIQESPAPAGGLDSVDLHK